MKAENNHVAKHLLIMTIVIIVVVVAGVKIAYETGDRYYMGIMMAAVAVIVFFGMLAIPGSYKQGNTFSEQRIRLAITATLLLEYLVYFGLVIFLTRDSEEGGFAKDLLPTLTTLLAVVVPFYFGASAAAEIASTRLKERKQEQSSGNN